ncbi:MAG: cytochrome c oxidase accessory protein CcoG [Gammaproteobacteria bacterium]|nr:cytochrome c oxidase accessory protein CcoG [Gammaproteobacteria bacterium]
MSTKEEQGVDSALYEELGSWHVNTGEETIHAKRMPGRFRNLKWLTSLSWLVFFFGPYLQYAGRQAILFDIPARKFYIFDITILPQDVWILSLILLFFAILLAAVTSVAGRMFCGYFCFQTIWTDIFTWIEEKVEGKPVARHKLDKSPWNFTKIRIRATKYFFWLLISLFTGISFIAWFTDAFQLWVDLLSLQATATVLITLGMFTAGTFILAGFMREQVCFWLCPYARIQGVMYDSETILPTYDTARGEPRGRLRKGGLVEGNGDCISCNMCVAVCPTGVDIREGQQEGCITCGLCLDACDSVMEKIKKPLGLIRYASLDEMTGKPKIPMFKRIRVLVYIGIMTFALSGIIYGLLNLGSMELKVIHERQPLFVLQSDGSIQNKYVIKILNKTDLDEKIKLTVQGPEGLRVRGAENLLDAGKSHVTPYTIFLNIPKQSLKAERVPVIFHVEMTVQKAAVDYESMFFGPAK